MYRQHFHVVDVFLQLEHFNVLRLSFGAKTPRSFHVGSENRNTLFLKFIKLKYHNCILFCTVESIAHCFFIILFFFSLYFSLSLCVGSDSRTGRRFYLYFLSVCARKSRPGKKRAGRVSVCEAVLRVRNSLTRTTAKARPD